MEKDDDDDDDGGRHMKEEKKNLVDKLRCEEKRKKVVLFNQYSRTDFHPALRF